MNTFTYWFIILLFFGINFSILFYDILYRIIPNFLLLALLLFLPVWWWLFSPISFSTSFFLIFLSLLLLLVGILYHKESMFLGSGDIKYGAILILYLLEVPVSVFIGNVGILTLATLFILWAMILGFTFGFGGITQVKKEVYTIIKKSLITIKTDILLALFDWICIGFLLSLLLKDISLGVFQIIPVHTDLYFLLSIGIFLTRSLFRRLILQGKYKIYPIFGILLYLGNFIQINTIEIFHQDFLLYLGNIWKYALLFICIQTVIQNTFSVYDKLLHKNKGKNLHTIPFSIILFIAFVSIYFFHMKLTESIRIFF